MANPSENLRKALEIPECISCAEDLLKPLKLMYNSLHETGDAQIADNQILDFIRQVQAFGMCLTQLDIRQESTRWVFPSRLFRGSVSSFP
jgi:phosphoenolpyruvate carboxylase